MSILKSQNSGSDVSSSDSSKKNKAEGKVAKNGVSVPAGVEISFNKLSKILLISTNKLKRELELKKCSDILIKDNVVYVLSKEKSIAGTYTSLIKNELIGIISPFKKKLNLVGVGLKAQLKNQGTHKLITFSLGYSHSVDYIVPDEIDVDISSGSQLVEIVISGVSKQEVGQVAANIKKLKPYEPYKGKGFHLEGEQLETKEGKKS